MFAQTDYELYMHLYPLVANHIFPQHFGYRVSPTVFVVIQGEPLHALHDFTIHWLKTFYSLLIHFDFKLRERKNLKHSIN